MAYKKFDLLAEEGTKSCVISAISCGWPVTVRKVYYHVKSRGMSVTYQCVHKSIRELVQKGILIKDGKRYTLNIEWIERMEKYAWTLRELYNKSLPSIDKIVSGEESGATFSSLKDFLEFYVNLLDSFSKTSAEAYGVFRHLWWTLSFNSSSHKRFKEAVSRYSSIRFACSGNTKADKLISEHYSSISNRVSTVLGFKNNQPYDLLVFGDCIVQVYFPQDLLLDLDMAYDILNGTGARVGKLLETLSEGEARISILVSRNKRFAEELKGLQPFKKNHQYKIEGR